MFQLQKFEQTLRGDQSLTPKTKSFLAKIHKHCTGKAHANGVVDHTSKDLSKSESSASIHSKKSVSSAKAEFFLDLKNGGEKEGVYSKSFSNSTSSYDGHSDTDSEMTRPDGKAVEPFNRHNSINASGRRSCEISARLFNTSTRASHAKTAKMRYVDDEVDNIAWIDNPNQCPKLNIGPHFDETNGGDKVFEDSGYDDTVDHQNVKKKQAPKLKLDLSKNYKHDEAPKTPMIRRNSSSSSIGKSRIAPSQNGKNSPLIKPPWRNVYQKSPSSPPDPFIRGNLARSSILNRRKNSHATVSWQVLYELSLRRKFNDYNLGDINLNRRGLLKEWKVIVAEAIRASSPEARSEEQLAKEKEWLDAELMWLAHRGGFTAVRRLASERPFDDGKVRVKVQQTGDIVTVDEDDLEKANPPQFERAEDIAGLRCLNECSALDVLRARLVAGLPHTYAGDTLIVINPRTHLPIYSDKIAALFKGCKQEDMPPHVYAAAQSAYRSMLTSRRDRAIVLLGRSGSGKSSVLKHCLQYLAVAAGSAGGYLTVEKLGAVHTVLEAFGNCRTGANSNATRFVSLFSLDFDQAGLIASASVQTLLLEKTLAARRPTTESTFHVVYRLFCGCDNRLRRDLFLDSMDQHSANPFLTVPDSLEERQKALGDFSQLRSAFSIIGVTEEEQKVIWNILAAIIHLGWAGVSRANPGGALKYQFANPVSANRAAQLLGCAPEELARMIFSTVSGGLSPTNVNGHKNSIRSPSPTGSLGAGLGSDRDITALEALEGLVIGLYAEVFNCVAALINRCLTTPARTIVSLLILDTPGADNPLGRGEQGGAPLPRLMHNYLQERLQAALHDGLLVAPREKYSQEGILIPDLEEHDWISEAVSPVHMVELLDRSPQNAIVHSSQADLRDCDRRGVLWLLDEESMYPGSSDESFLERVFLHYGSSIGSANGTNGTSSNSQSSQSPKYHHLVKRAPHANQFIIQHFQGTNPVLYNVTGWLKASRENPVTKKAIGLLQESTNDTLSRLVVWSRGAGCGLMQTATPGDVQSAATLRRASSIRRTLTQGTAGMKRGSVALHARFASDALLDALRRCGSPGGIKFICCMLAQHANIQTNGDNIIEDVNVPLMRSQFRGFQLLDVARLYKQGFPEYMPLGEFARRFRILAFPHGDTDSNRDASSPTISDMVQRDRQLVEDMLLALDLDATTYRLGQTQNDNNTTKSEGRQKTQIKQLKNKTIILKKNIDAKRRQIETLRKKVYRLQQTEREHINLKQSIRSTYIQCKNLKEKTLLKKILLQSNMKYKSTVLGLTGKIRTKLQNHRRNKNVDCIKRFFLRDDISRATSGKKECKTKHKKKKQIRYLVDTLQKLYVTYVREGGRVSFTTFTRYKPFYVLSPSVRNRNTCLCVKHSNMQFMAHALKKRNILNTESLTDLMKDISCDTRSYKCMLGQCTECANKTGINTENVDPLDNIAWLEWSRKDHVYTKTNKNGTKESATTKKTTKVLKNGTIMELLKDFKKTEIQFKKHHFNMNHQQFQYKQCITNLKVNEAMVHCDFFENFECKLSEEIQAMHFGASKTQITLHTGIFYVYGKKPYSFCSISPSNDHQPGAIWAHLLPVIQKVRSVAPAVNIVHFFSDGPSSQYRQKKNFYLFNSFTARLGLTYATWNFFEAGHGKGAADGIGGAVKRTLDRQVAFGNDITNAMEAYDQLKQNMKSVQLYYITEEAVERITKEVPNNLMPLPGTLNVHQIASADGEKIIFRVLSCFCGFRRGMCQCYSPGEHVLRVSRENEQLRQHNSKEKPKTTRHRATTEEQTKGEEKKESTKKEEQKRTRKEEQERTIKEEEEKTRKAEQDRTRKEEQEGIKQEQQEKTRIEEQIGQIEAQDSITVSDLEKIDIGFRPFDFEDLIIPGLETTADIFEESSSTNTNFYNVTPTLFEKREGVLTIYDDCGEKLDELVQMNKESVSNLEFGQSLFSGNGTTTRILKDTICNIQQKSPSIAVKRKITESTSMATKKPKSDFSSASASIISPSSAKTGPVRNEIASNFLTAKNKVVPTTSRDVSVYNTPKIVVKKMQNFKPSTLLIPINKNKVETRFKQSRIGQFIHECAICKCHSIKTSRWANCMICKKSVCSECCAGVALENYICELCLEG